MSAPYEPYSDESGNDSDDAPEEVTLSTVKKDLQQEKKKALEEQRRYARLSYTILALAATDSKSSSSVQTSARKEREEREEQVEGEEGERGKG